MPIALILLVIGLVFVIGGVKNISITGLLTGKIKDRGGSSGTIGDFSGVSTSGGTTDTVPQNHPTENNVVRIARKYLGTPYKFGGNDPNIGIDCSRFVQLVFTQVGIALGRTTFDQFKEGTSVSLNNLQPGDVIFTRPTPEGPDHEGLYIGNNQVQQSPHTGEVNNIVPLNVFLGDGLVGVRRYL